MAKQTGPRRIVVEGATYVWTAQGTDSGIVLAVALDTGQQPERPRKRPDGKRVRTRVDEIVPHSSMWTTLDHANIVSPSLVRRMILLAIEEGWRPTEREPGRAFRRRGVFPDEAGVEPVIASEVTRDALLAAIVDAPDDDAPRRVLADWLLQRDAEVDRARGEYILLACMADRSPKLDARMSELLAQHELAWLGPVADVTRGTWSYGTPRLWSRGFLDAVCLERRERGVIAASIGHPIWRTVRTVEARGYWLSEEDQLRLVCQPALAKLHGLYVAADFVEPLAEHDEAPRITEFAIHPISRNSPAAPLETLYPLLAEHPAFANVRRLHLYQITPDVIRVLMRPGLSLVAICGLDTIASWLAELDTRSATFDDVRFSAGVSQHLVRDGVEATLRRGSERWSVLDVRWTSENDPVRRAALLQGLARLPRDRLTHLSLLGPEAAAFDVAAFRRTIVATLRTQSGLEIVDE